MTYTETLKALCESQHKVSEHLNNYNNDCDCFCKQGGYWPSKEFPDRTYDESSFRNSGVSIAYMVKAVEEKIAADKLARQKKISLG